MSSDGNHEIFIKNQLQVIETEDGSVSLVDLSLPVQESMHHRRGAYSETQLVYGELVRQTLDQNKDHFLVVGLGCGYIEILLAYEVLLKKYPPEKIWIQTFETNDFLKQMFLENILNKNSETNIVFHKISGVFSNDTRYQDVQFEDVKKLLRTWTEKKQFSIEGRFDLNQKWAAKFNGICFDAFSSKSQPELWDEKGLQNFLQQAAADACLFSTYACTGALVRALKANNFTVEKKEGFKGKRERTWATRGARI